MMGRRITQKEELKMTRVILSVAREAYGVYDIKKTMTVGELIDFLQQNFEEESPIYISHDNGYTYGSILESRFDEIEEDDEEE